MTAWVLCCTGNWSEGVLKGLDAVDEGGQVEIVEVWMGDPRCGKYLCPPVCHGFKVGALVVPARVRCCKEDWSAGVLKGLDAADEGGHVQVAEAWLGDPRCGEYLCPPASHIPGALVVAVWVPC